MNDFQYSTEPLVNHPVVKVSDYFMGREIHKRGMMDKLMALFKGRGHIPMWLAQLEIIVELKERIERLENAGTSS